MAGLPITPYLAPLVETLQRSTVQIQGSSGGMGSGVIWNADGLIITNAHVVTGNQVTVKLTDGREFEAEVSALDPRQDLAALQVNATDLPAATLGDSQRIRVGEMVLAVGHPLGWVGALNTGIIHSLADPDWIRADVRLAPGNSGGPLATVRGEVIGINSMIAGGLALAVPSHQVQAFLRIPPQQTHRLGVTIRPIRLWRRGLGLQVLQVETGSLAARAGVNVGDLLLKANHRPFRQAEDLSRILAGAQLDQGVPLELIRDGHWLTLVVTDPVGAAA